MNVLAVAIWIAVIVSSVLLSRTLRRASPVQAGPAGLHDLSEAAFVRGGPGAVVDVALVSMLGDGRLVVGGPGIVQVRPGARATDPAERAVLEAHRGAPSGWLYQVRYAAMRDPAVQEIGDALAARGLISPPGSRRPGRRWALVQAAVCALLIPVSVVLTFVGFAVDPHSAVPFIGKVAAVLVVGIMVGLISALRARSRVPRAGLRALLAMRTAYRHDQSPHVRTALFGLGALRDPFLRQQLVPAARGTRLAAAQAASRPHGSDSSSGSGAEFVPVFWCAGSDGGGSGGGSGCGSGGSGCGSSGSSCGGSGSSCSGSSGSSCGGSSSSCSSSSSSCSSSSSSSCSSSS
uniref:TIGR04222 domain-containing membrane protein n=1 Tax=Streptomyces sp. NBC_00049 TaxID=2903617 RepID=A0AAU2JWP7_9ACTN